MGEQERSGDRKERQQPRLMVGQLSVGVFVKCHREKAESPITEKASWWKFHVEFLGSFGSMCANFAVETLMKWKMKFQNVGFAC